MFACLYPIPMLDDLAFQPDFEAAQQLDVPIYLHPAPPPQAVQKAYYRGLPEGYGQMLSIAGWEWHVETGLREDNPWQCQAAA